MVSLRFATLQLTVQHLQKFAIFLSIQNNTHMHTVYLQITQRLLYHYY